MHRMVTSALLAVAAAGAVLIAFAFTAPSAGAAPAPPGAQLWVSRYNGPGDRYDDAYSVAVSPDRTKVFVTGASYSETVGGIPHVDYATIAYNAATGEELWVSRYNGPGNGDDSATSIVVSPDGSKVFVTGSSLPAGAGSISDYDYATVAYNAATGAQLWVSRYNGPGNGVDMARSVAVSPDGTKVFVTGDSNGGLTTNVDYATVAYNAATGEELWVSRYNGPGNGSDAAMSVAASPDGTNVLVTGWAYGGSTTGTDYATVAYSAATGAQVWAQLYTGTGSGTDAAYSITVSPGKGQQAKGSTVFVTGYSVADTSTNNTVAATVAYRADTGEQLWAQRYSGILQAQATAVAVNPKGSQVFVTGFTSGPNTAVGDYATVAYDTSTGAQLWAQRYNGPGNGDDKANSLAVNAKGDVFVTGVSYGGITSGNDYATVAYSGAKGGQLWASRYNGPGNSTDIAYSVAASPDGTVLVTGSSLPAGATSASQTDYATVAYQG